MAKTITAPPAPTKTVERPNTAAPVAVPAPESPRVASRACPTRLDGVDPLFQHRVTVSQCESKQGKQYHKCFTCAHGCDRG